MRNLFNEYIPNVSSYSKRRQQIILECFEKVKKHNEDIKKIDKLKIACEEL